MEKDILRKGTILIVDDEHDVLFFISKVFQPQGYHTITAGTGIEALKYLEELRGKIDLVLLDLRMPEMGGVQVLKKIRKEYADLPVIVLTAYGQHRKQVEDIGVEGFMTKPYSLEELYQKVAWVLERKEFEKATFEPEIGMIPAAKVLVVDDEKEVCELIAGALAEDVPEVEFQVRTAYSGEQALEIAQEFEPDIAVIDIRMPLMWGDELIACFKRGEAPCPKDFIVFTAKDDQEEKAKAQKTGYKFVSKSTRLEDLIDVLKKTCVKLNLVKRKS